MAQHRTGEATGAEALSAGYGLGMAVGAVLLALAAAVAGIVLPRRRPGT